MPKHVLILTYSFPPDGRIAALRPYKMAQAFLAAGWDVTVLRSAYTGAAPLAPKDTAGMVVRSYSPNFGSRWLANSYDSQGTRASNWTRSTLRRAFLPDHTWLLRQPVRDSLDAVLSDHRPDCIISIAFPFVLHDVCRERFAHRGDIFWVADNRDQWSGNPYRGARSRFARAVERRVEARCLGSADLVTFAAQSTEKHYRELYGLTRTTTIYNGYEDKPQEPFVSDRNIIRVVHTGGLYGGKRSFEPLLAAMSILGHRFGLEFELSLYGDSYTPTHTPTNVVIRHHGRVSLADSYAAQESADFNALAMAPSAFDTTYVPAKLFEYARAGRPILALVHETSEVSRIVASHSLGIGTLDPDAIAQTIQTHLRAPSRQPPPDLSARYQFNELISTINKAAG